LSFISESVIVVKSKWAGLQLYHWQEQATFWWADDDVCFVL